MRGQDLLDGLPIEMMVGADGDDALAVADGVLVRGKVLIFGREVLPGAEQTDDRAVFTAFRVEALAADCSTQMALSAKPAAWSSATTAGAAAGSGRMPSTWCIG